MTQFALAFFGLTAMWLAMGRDPRGRRWAPIVGLCGQPFWIWFAYTVEAWGLMLLAFSYTGVYIRGAWLQWSAR